MSRYCVSSRADVRSRDKSQLKQHIFEKFSRPRGSLFGRKGKSTASSQPRGIIVKRLRAALLRNPFVGHFLVTSQPARWAISSLATSR